MTLALWMALVACVLPYIAHAFVVLARFQLGYEPHDPRRQSGELTGWGKRAWAAELNAFEALPAAVTVFFIAHLTHVDPTSVGVLGGSWIGFRLGHLAAYMGDIPMLRSAMFGLANLSLIGLIYQAAML